MKKKALFGLAAVALIVAAYFIVKHLTRTEEERVRSVVTGLTSDLEKNNLPLCVWGMRAKLSEKYRHRGERTSITIDKQLALAYVVQLKQQLAYEDFKVEIREMKVTLDADAKTARVEVTGRITAAKKGKPEERVELMTEPGQNKAIVDLAKEDGDWMVVGSERVQHKLAD